MLIPITRRTYHSRARIFIYASIGKIVSCSEVGGLKCQHPKTSELHPQHKVYPCLFGIGPSINRTMSVRRRDLHPDAAFLDPFDVAPWAYSRLEFALDGWDWARH